MIASKAFNASIHRPNKAEGEKVTIPLELLSQSLLETAEELETAKEKAAKLQKILWEGRYCKYISAGLAKIRTTEAWKAYKRFHGVKWGAIRGYLLVRDAGLDAMLESAGLEMKLPVEALQAWIGLYADRYESKYHHAGFAQLLENCNVDGVRGQILADTMELTYLTPPHMECFIPHIRAAMMSFRGDIFEYITKDDWVMTKHGKMVKPLKPTT
jgi:hypothetical protein